MADEFAKFAGIFPIERAEPAAGAAPIITLEEFAQAELAVEEALRGSVALLMRGGEPEKSAISKVAQATGTSISAVYKATEAWPWSVAPWK